MARRLLGIAAMAAVVTAAAGMAAAQTPPPEPSSAPVPSEAGPAAASPDSQTRPWTVGVQGGLAMASLLAGAEVQAPFGLVVGVAGGARRGPLVGAHLAYDVRLGERWSLRPGGRVSRLWTSSNDDSCTFSRCIYDFAIVEIGARLQLGYGFTLDVGVPLAGIIPTSPEPGDKRARVSFDSLVTTPELLILSTVLLGWNFAL